MQLPSEAVVTDVRGNPLKDGTRIFFVFTRRSVVLDPYDPGLPIGEGRLMRGTIIAHRFKNSSDMMWLIDPDDKDTRPVFLERHSCLAEKWAIEHGLRFP